MALRRKSSSDAVLGGTTAQRIEQSNQHNAMSKLPDDLKWSEASAALLAETDKTSAKSVCIAVKKAADAKDSKEAAMSVVVDLCTWAKDAQARELHTRA